MQVPNWKNRFEPWSWAAVSDKKLIDYAVINKDNWTKAVSTISKKDSL
jgi:hypothetical protein